VTASRRAKRAAEAAGFRLFVALVRALPHGAAVRLGAGLGSAAFALGLRRRVARRNVAERLAPAGGAREVDRIARESYRVAGRTFVHLVRADLLGDDVVRGAIAPEDVASVRAAVRPAGAVLVSGHFGNWELLVVALRRAGLEVAAMAGDQANAVVDRQVRSIRARAGVQPLSARSGLRGALGVLRRGGCVATLMDQDARDRGVFVDFLGAPASAHVGPVSLAMRTGVPLVPGVLVDDRGRYRFARGTVWSPDPDATDEENLRAGAVHFHRFLEEHVRRDPANYFWAHRRWKTRPPPSAEPGP